MLGLIDLHLPPDLFDQIALYRDELIFAARAGHPLSTGAPAPADLARFPLAVPVYVPGPEQELAHILAQSGVERPAILRANTLGLIRELMFAADHIAFLPRQMIAGDLARGALAQIDVGLRQARGPGGVILLRHRPRSAATDHIIALLHQRSGGE